MIPVEELRARALQAVSEGDGPMTPALVATRAQLTTGGALRLLRELTAAGQLVCLPAVGKPAPHHDRYALPSPTDRSDAMPTTEPPAPTRKRPPVLVAALAYAERGWHVFPLTPGAKRPAVKAWEERATTDPERIERAWNHGPYGIGVATGPSHLVVVDLDRPKTGQTPPPEWARDGISDGADVLADVAATAGHPAPWDTHTVSTGRGGTHLYFTAPDGAQLRNTAGALGWLVDTRAAGGYVVAPPTVVEGRAYRVTADTDPAPLPEWLGACLAPAPMPDQAPVTVPLRATGDARRDAYLRTAITRQVEAVTAAAEGGRNRALYLSAVSLGQLIAGGALAADGVTSALTDAARSAGLDPTETARTLRSGLRAGAKRPRTLDTAVSAAQEAA